MATKNAADAAASRSNTATPVPDPAAGFLGPRAPSQTTSAFSGEASALSQMPMSPPTPQVPSSTPKMLSETPVVPPLFSSFPVKLASSDTNSGSAAAPKSWKELAKDATAISQAQLQLQAPAPSADPKRKVTDPHLKVVTIDPFYDLTVIVGTPSSIGGQTAFRVNKSSLRHASEVWTKALTGHWGARLENQSEIEFSEDSPWAFEQVLRIAHLQTDHLAPTLTLAEMKSLAVLTDKYDLAKVMQMPINFKGWLLAPYLTWRLWPADSSLQDWAFVTHVFQYKEDYNYLVNRLAMEVQTDGSDSSFYHVTGDKKTKLRADLPGRLLEQIQHVRDGILEEWILLCNTVFDTEILQTNNPCGKAICRATRIGIFTLGLRAAGFYPFPQSAQTMHLSVASYWKALKNIGSEFKVYKPCDGTLGYGKGNHHSSCSYEKCLGDLGLLTRAEATLKKYGHKDVFSHMLSDEFLKI